MMTKKTVRLLMPQWQGGNNQHYSFGAELLAWLAPKNDQPLIEVPVKSFDGSPLENENGMNGRAQLFEQMTATQHLLEAHKPDRVVILGGDCLVEQAPFSYLNEKYDGNLGVLWIDAHSDLVRFVGYDNGHTLPLGNLLGEGDKQFSSLVTTPIKPENVFIAGLATPSQEEESRIIKEIEKAGVYPEEAENDVISRLGLRTSNANELAESTDSIKEWIKENEIKHLAIHLDLDVLDPTSFRSLLFANPDEEYHFSAAGSIQRDRLVQIIKEVSEATEVVGLGITEHMPWDAINLKKMLEAFPILND
jgi:arginase